MNGALPRILAFDTETTGVDTESDRIVQAFLGIYDPSIGGWAVSQEWLIDPGVEVPEGAAAVHGYTTERIRAEGTKDAAGALAQIAAIIRAEASDRVDTALTIYNAPYDTTILNAELRRHGLEEIEYSHVQVIDPLVIDKALYRFRRGSGMRKLTAIAPIYGVPVEENSHDAGADCLMTARVAIKQLNNATLNTHTLEALQRAQKAWKSEQSASLEAWFRTKAPEGRRDPNMVIPREWPILSRKEHT